VAIVISVCCDTLYPTVETVDDTPPAIDAKAKYWSRIAILGYTTCIQRPRWGRGGRRNIAIAFVTEKLVWCGYPLPFQKVNKVKVVCDD